MKKILLSTFIALVFHTGFSQTTATNFTSTDCASLSHTLFTELDAGKVIVITWPMPCGACIAPASTAATTVQGYATSNPGRVKFYLVDDNGGTSCSSLNSWASTNSITADAVFGNSGNVIKMTDYGTSGMPKTVVLGGTSHTVYYNVNGSVSASALQTAITNGLNATTGIAGVGNVSSLNVFPNPANNFTSISYSLTAASDVKIELYNIIGENIRTVFTGIQAAGEFKTTIDCSALNNGFYFVKIISGKIENTVLLSVSH
ncbi:MAG: T9SS type A sorting domain-containing protein [Bacteroidetes bacterium]|nr:MAG: T9SS type A sorting domain-containing protein [Bacteroidota bacterium]